MNFQNRKLLSYSLGAILFIFFIIHSLIRNTYWSPLDYRLNDWFYKATLNENLSLNTNKILYLSITDDTYRNLFRDTKIKRDAFAAVVEKLLTMDPELILIDLIFNYPSKIDTFLISTLNNEVIYLPLAVVDDIPGNRFLNKIIPVSSRIPGKNRGSIKFESKTVIPDIFMNQGEVFKYGHINVYPDVDGIYRHSSVILWLDSFYIPSLPLRAFLDYCKVPSKNVLVKEGEKLIIPASNDSWIRSDIIIPLNTECKMFVPYKNKWGKDFLHLSFDHFMELYENPGLKTKLADLIGGRVIIIGDLSSGTSDLASTPLDNNVPLISLFASELNAYLNNSFFIEINNHVVSIIAFTIFLLISYSAAKGTKIFYFSSASILILLLFTGIILVHFNSFLPIITLIIYSLIMCVCIFSYISYVDIRESNRLQKEVIISDFEFEEARKLQLSLLPDKFTETNQVEIKPFLRSALKVGGDFYDIKYSGEDILLLLSDVVGHGLKAGIMSLMLKTIFTSVDADTDVLSILSRMHNEIRKLKVKRFNASLILLKIINDKLSFASAGMPPVLHFKYSTREIVEILSTSLPIGSLYFKYEAKEVNLAKGDIFLFYSDGLLELNNKNGEMFGIERVKDIIARHNSKPLIDLRDVIDNRLNEWIYGCEPYDDVSFLLIRVK